MKQTISYIRQSLLLLACMVLVCTAMAQKRKKEKDTMLLYREFIGISRDYQQPPLQARIVFRKASNLLQMDTTSSMAEFHLQKGSGYINFGEVEQLATDSMMLLVNNRLKRMVLVQQDSIAANGMASFMPAFPAQAVEAMAKKYTAKKTPLDGGDTLIRLDSRKLLPGTNTPLETLEIRYANRLNPVLASVTKNSFAPLSDSAFFKKELLPQYKVQVEGKGEHLLRQQTDEYLFQHIGHDANRPLPITMGNRVVKGSNNQWIPAKGYEQYSIKKQ
jgi:hypothetical protein